MRTAHVVVVVLVCLAAAPLSANEFDAVKLENWHQWRGPLATGVAPAGDPPVSWSEETNIRWKVAIPGAGSSTPIVWGDRIFLLTAVDTGRVDPDRPKPADQPQRPFGIKYPNSFYQFVVLCLDRKDGAVRWKRVAREEVPHEGHHSDNNFASASPTTDGKLLYASFGSRGVYCYDLEGDLRWNRDLGDMQTRRSFGEGSSPVVHGDSLVVNWDHDGASFLALLDAKTGETRWKVKRDEKSSWATPLVVRHGDRTQVVANGTNRVRSYDLSSGDLVWQCGGQTVNVIPSPVTDRQLVFCMSGYRGNAVYAIPLDSMGDISEKADKIAWHRSRGTPYVPSPLLYGNLLYFTQKNSGVLSCLRKRDGEPLIDRERLPGIRSIYASPVGAADRVYLVSRDGTAIVAKRGAPFQILATNHLDEAVDASPAVVGKQLFLRGREHLYCIEEKRGEP